MSPLAQVIHPFRVIVFDEGDVMCAQVLEHDFAVHGRTLEEINDRLRGMIATHILTCAQLGREPFSDTHRAPHKYWDWFEKAENLPTFKWEMPNIKPRVEIPRPEIRIAAAVKLTRRCHAYPSFRRWANSSIAPTITASFRDGALSTKASV